MLSEMFAKITRERPSPEERAAIRFESSEQEAFSRWVWNEISDSEYFVANSMLVAAKRELHTPIPLPQSPEFVRQYVTAREMGTADWDNVKAKRLRKWVVQYTADLDENNQRLGTIVWAKSHMDRTGQTSESGTLGEVLLRFEKLRHVEREFWKSCLSVMRKDSQEGKV